MKYRDFLRILTDRGFALDRTRGSHRTYVGFVDGQRKIVTVDCSQEGEDISPRNLASMIRQSGLAKNLFR